jgi:hypothetical protein
MVESTPAPYAGTQYWNGTSWAEVGDLGANRDYGGGGGSTASVAIMAGGSPPVTNATEEWTVPDLCS